MEIKGYLWTDPHCYDTDLFIRILRSVNATPVGFVDYRIVHFGTSPRVIMSFDLDQFVLKLNRDGLIGLRTSSMPNTKYYTRIVNGFLSHDYYRMLGLNMDEVHDIAHCLLRAREIIGFNFPVTLSENDIEWWTRDGTVR